MRHPKHNCPECGHRLYAHVDSGAFCPECGYYFDIDDDGGKGARAGSLQEERTVAQT